MTVTALPPRGAIVRQTAPLACTGADSRGRGATAADARRGWTEKETENSGTTRVGSTSPRRLDTRAPTCDRGGTAATAAAKASTRHDWNSLARNSYRVYRLCRRVLPVTFSMPSCSGY